MQMAFGNPISQLARPAVLENVRTPESTGLLELLEGVTWCGVFVVDRQCRVLCANRTARTLVAAERGLTLGSRGELRAAEPTQDGKLRSLIVRAVAASYKGDDARRGFVRVAANVAMSPLAVIVSPLRMDLLAGSGEWGAALVAVKDPTARLRVSRRALAALYCLTPREAEVAANLALGKSLDEIADDLGTGRESVRSHLKHVMAKVGVHRQHELVRHLLLGCPLEDHDEEAEPSQAVRMP